VPTTSADEEKYAPEGQYWRGSIWAPTNHMVVKGLEANNRNQLAREIVTNHLNNISLVYQSTGTVWENYSSEFIKPGKPWAKPDFVGWSALGPIAQLIEFYIGIKLDVPHNKINWELLTTESVGLRNLKFGDSFVELVAAERIRLEDEIQISVKTSKEFDLYLNNGKKLFKKNIPPGKHEFKFV
jgi:glycogen debranching enzyme